MSTYKLALLLRKSLKLPISFKWLRKRHECKVRKRISLHFPKWSQGGKKSKKKKKKVKKSGRKKKKILWEKNNKYQDQGTNYFCNNNILLLYSKRFGLNMRISKNLHPQSSYLLYSLFFFFFTFLMYFYVFSYFFSFFFRTFLFYFLLVLRCLCSNLGV